MPKVLLYITAKIVWTFLFWGTDTNENRAHVHIGKKGTAKLAKIWLEPTISIADKGSLTDAQIKNVTYRSNCRIKSFAKQVFMRAARVSNFSEALFMF